MELRFTLIDQEPTPLGLLTLHHYRASDGTEGYEVRLDDAFLMASHGAQGEACMARLAWERLGEPRRDLAVLVGGLGAGHTLRAALCLPGVAAVEVVEVGARVVDWNRRYFAAAHGCALDDARVRVRVADLAAVLRAAGPTWDLVLLDVDNGPGWLAAAGNAWLYGPEGLVATMAALRPGGVLAIWSPGPNPAFLATLRSVCVRSEEVRTATPGERGEDVVYVVAAPR
jgi:spermidine synthase